MLRLPVAHSSLLCSTPSRSSVSSHLSSSRLMSGSEARAHVRTSIECEMSVGGCNFLPPPSLAPLPRRTLSLLFPEPRDSDLSLRSISGSLQDRGLTYNSRARLRNTRDRSVDRSRAASMLFLPFAAPWRLLLLSWARFACDARRC